MVLIRKSQLRASILKDEFYEFVQYFWDVVVPEDPHWNWHIKYLCDEVQYVLERMMKKKEKEHDLIINISPGSTKSTICSVMATPWLWTRMPTARTINGSYAHMLALDLSRKARLIIQSDKYQTLFPDVSLSEDQNTKGYFATTRGGGRLAVGTGGAVTGFHGHAIFVDDPLNPNEALSEADLLSANNWMRETLPTRKVDKAIVPTILIMQRLAEDDPTGNRLARVQNAVENQEVVDPVKHICLPAEIGENVNPPELKDMYVDGLMDPVRLSKKVLKEAKSALGIYGYAGQFEQSPVPRGGGRMKISEIIMERIPPTHFVRRVRYWDKAATKDGGCRTAGVLMGLDRHGFYWWLDSRIGQWEPFERERIIRQTAEADGPSVMIGIEEEGGSGGKESAQNTVRNLVGFNVYKDKPTGDKEKRAYPLGSQVGGGNTKMLVGDWNLELLNELKYWPKSKYKDQVDASSGAFAKLYTPPKRVGGLW